MAATHAEPRRDSASVRRLPSPTRAPRTAPEPQQPNAARALQQRLGNEGTHAALRFQMDGRQGTRAAATTGPLSSPPANERAAEMQARPSPIQASLTISQPGDALEEEADRVADTVMRVPAPPPQVPGISATGRQVQAQASQVAPRVEANVRALQGEGSPLPPATREFFETRFGTDFSQVRVNTGGRAEETAKLLGAKAFTVGRSITFGAGQYAPASREGQRLLAHELTHVVQQDAVIRRIGTPVQRQKATQNESPAKGNRVNLTIGKTADAPHVQAAWYNFPIPFTDYEFDPSLEGLKTAGNLAADKAKEGASWVKGKVVEMAEWVVERLKSLINSGIEWLTEKFNDIKEFAVSSFADIKRTVSGALGAITSPLGIITNAIGAMDASILSAAWRALTAGANAAWQTVKAAVNGVLKFGGGIWETVSGFVNFLFDTVDDLLDSRAFDLLPGFVQAPIKGLYKKLRDLWTSIRDFWTDFWKRLTSFVNDLLVSIEAFVGKVLSYTIDKVIDTVKKLKEVYDFVKRLVADPESVIKPIITSIAGKINAEAPGKAREVAQQKIAEALAASPSSQSSGMIVHRSPDVAAPKRATATRAEVNANVTRELDAQWPKLDIPKMLWDTVKNLFWPPATIRAIGDEFYELWNTDWKNTLDSLFVPRSIFDDFGGFWHDVWSNVLVLLDFPLALWRRLNSILMLLMGYVTILLILVGLVGGFIVGNVPGALAGAAAGAKLAWAIGEALFLSFVFAESASALKAFLDLYTARQTEQEKKRDYVQIAASVIGMSVAMIVAILFSLLGAFVRNIVGRIKGSPPKLPPGPEPRKQLPPGPEAPKQLPPGPEAAKQLPPGPEAPKQLPEGPAKAGSIDESRAKFSPEERRIAKVLESEGKKVEALPRSTVEGERTADAIVDGRPAEFKSMSPGADSATVRNEINNSIRGPGQARDIILDARGSGLSEAEAIRGLNRVGGITRGKIDSVRIIGDGYDITRKYP